MWRSDGLTWRSTASVDAMLQDSFVLCLRARMCMFYEPGEPGERGLSFLYDFLCLILMRRLPMQACIFFVRSCLRRCGRVRGWMLRGPSLGLRRWVTSLDTKEVTQRLRASLWRLWTRACRASGSSALHCQSLPRAGPHRPFPGRAPHPLVRHILSASSRSGRAGRAGMRAGFGPDGTVCAAHAHIYYVCPPSRRPAATGVA